MKAKSKTMTGAAWIMILAMILTCTPQLLPSENSYAAVSADHPIEFGLQFDNGLYAVTNAEVFPGESFAAMSITYPAELDIIYPNLSGFPGWKANTGAVGKHHTISFIIANPGQNGTSDKVMKQNGMAEGFPDGTFRPNEPISREEFAALAVRFAGENTSAGNGNFPDVPENSWAAPYIAAAAKYGWVSGHEDGTFRPKDDITRAQAVTITNREENRNADRAFIDKALAEKKIHAFKDVQNTYWAFYDIIEASAAHDYTRKEGTETWADLIK